MTRSITSASAGWPMGSVWFSSGMKPATDFGCTCNQSKVVRRARLARKEWIRHSLSRRTATWSQPWGADHKLNIYPINGGDPRPVPGVLKDEIPTAWSSDGRSLFVYLYGGLPARVVQIDIATGQRKPLKELYPADAAGIDTISGILMTPDAKSYVYAYVRTLSDLYLVEGLK